MSWLLLDVGNTALKWVLLSAAAARWPAFESARSSLGGEGADEVADSRGLRATHGVDSSGLGRRLAAALTGAPAPAAILGCAVASDETIASIEAVLHAACGVPVQWLGATEQFEHEGIFLQNTYRNPAQLGADRWHALIGARACFPREALAVINAGTATTIDGLDAQGRFLGGVIVPGIEMMRAGLVQGTARLPLAGGKYAAHPDSTDDAIRTGILDAQCGAIERRARRIREITGTEPMLIVSGGKADELFPLLRAHDGFGALAREPDLVLQGLWRRARELARAAVTSSPGAGRSP